MLEYISIPHAFTCDNARVKICPSTSLLMLSEDGVTYSVCITFTKKVKEVYRCFTFVAVHTSDGEVWTCDGNSLVFSQVGDKTITMALMIVDGVVNTCTLLEDGDVLLKGQSIGHLFPSLVVSVMSGLKHCLFLTEDGDVYGLGRVSFDSAGEFETYTSPTLIALPEKIGSIRARAFSSAFVSLDGKRTYARGFGTAT